MAILYSQARSRLGALQTGQCPPRPQEHFLHGVLGVLQRAEHSVAVNVELAPVGLDDVAERSMVASGAASISS